MIWVKAIGVVIAYGVGFVIFLMIMVGFEDWVTNRFGKPPSWLGFITIPMWLFILTKMAKDWLLGQ
jgi:hypothetical protein